MKRQRRNLSSCSRPLAAHVLSYVLVLVLVAANCHRSTTKSPRLRHHAPGTAFISGTRPSLDLWRRSGQAAGNAYLARTVVDPGTDGSGLNGIAVHDEAWYLGDGGFAARHLEDDDRISAKKSEEEFFRERSLTVYDQMREASLLLLAQQQVLAAEEAREEASRPRFVPAAAGGSGAARTQVTRDRPKTRSAATGLLPPPSPTSSPTGERRGSDADAAVVVPTDPATLSGRSLGVGGLDEELEEIRRRVCVPLAAPAHLLEDLGISPVRGLLLHGPPGCGKTLLARRISALLTPRPPTVVSGPEILERFVGSSEANVRALFDYPPEVPGGGDVEQAGALHVIVLDEFDSIGQKRGGGERGNDGGDRVRDSVVNQLLARMDGFEELKRPTLLVALTNRIDLLDTALLRPGRFEVQIEIPGPDQAGREAILKIHTQRMNEAGRIDTPAADDAAGSGGGGTGYDDLISSLAAVTNGFTGAELAGLVRAAASYALERVVSDGDGASAAAECKVTAEDFGRGLADVNRSKTSVDGPIKGSRTLTHRGSVSVGDRRVDGSRSSNVESMGGSQVDQNQHRVSEESEAVAAAAVGAAGFKDGMDGGLSPEDLAAVQQLLRLRVKKASTSSSQKDEEDDLLLDAAHIVARRRRSSTRARNAGRSVDDGDGKARDSRLGKEEAEAEQQASAGRKGENSTPARRPTLKTFEHTGWFHTYE